MSRIAPPLLWRGGLLSLTVSVSSCLQGARVVVSRSYADFTPQATFDIKVRHETEKKITKMKPDAFLSIQFFFSFFHSGPVEM